MQINKVKVAGLRRIGSLPGKAVFIFVSLYRGQLIKEEFVPVGANFCLKNRPLSERFHPHGKQKESYKSSLPLKNGMKKMRGGGGLNPFTIS